ncbi:hypothetical protein PSHT_14719 [Puccinia striiformis]|uniref:hAT-like transposase RNase-H fold domain-containing protein n=1 Tax=Puccinia striiformis TaxID=27350 RepID=A0A2S4UIW5_9BASI|nr:hypothetical protein PSHT_14719 [Puccinia striiformis]
MWKTFDILSPTGNHSGQKFAELFYDVLEKYSAVNLMHTLTADNASVNDKMARQHDRQIPHFSSSTDILGCVAHVINLAAKLGITALGSIDDDNDGDEISMAAVDAGSDGESDLNTQTIIKCGMCTCLLNNALQKPIYICVMILDRRFKLSFWKNNGQFIIDKYSISADEVMKMFQDTAKEFYKNLPKENQKHPDILLQHYTNHLLEVSEFKKRSHVT